MLTSSNILFVGMVESPHFQDWVKNLNSLRLFNKIFIVPSDYPINSKQNLKVKMGSNVKIFTFPIGRKLNNVSLRVLDLFFSSKWRGILILYYLLVSRPKFLHFHEIQHSGYPYLSISRILKHKNIIHL